MNFKLLEQFVREVLLEAPGQFSAHEEDRFRAEVKELSFEPEMKSIETFVNSKIDNDDYELSTLELQALALSLDRKLIKNVETPTTSTVKRLKSELLDSYGFKFVPREAIKTMRGVTSSAHGTHPFAGSGGGGSGFGSDFGGTTFLSFGGGPGAMGSGKKWSSDDPSSLSMGSKRGRK